MPVATKSQKLTLDTLGYVIFFVKDVKACGLFYKDTLGLKGMIDPHWCEFELQSGVKLALHHEAEGKPAKPGSAEVVFNVADPLAAREALLAKGVKVEEPKVVFEAGPQVGVSCIFRDPAGNLLSVFGMVPAAKMTK